MHAYGFFYLRDCLARHNFLSFNWWWWWCTRCMSHKHTHIHTLTHSRWKVRSDIYLMCVVVCGCVWVSVYLYVCMSTSLYCLCAHVSNSTGFSMKEEKKSRRVLPAHFFFCQKLKRKWEKEKVVRITRTLYVVIIVLTCFNVRISVLLLYEFTAFSASVFPRLRNKQASWLWGKGMWLSFYKATYRFD